MDNKDKIIDGKAAAAKLRSQVAKEVGEFIKKNGEPPTLAVVLVGDDGASQVYVKNKIAACQETGIESREILLPAATTQADLLKEVAKLNQDKNVHGILVQFPLPPQIEQSVIINAIAPAKDVDGLHPINVGGLVAGQETALVPCTPQGALILIKSVCADIAGKSAVIIGRSNLVGKPLAQLLLRENATVTIAHSRTKNLAALCASADILIAAAGQPELVKGDWVKQGAVVIDVGIHKIINGEKSRLIGDVDFAAAAKNAAHITPVPGGVGPMTVACLMSNTLLAAKIQV